MQQWYYNKKSLYYVKQWVMLSPMNNLALNSKDNQQAWAEYLAGLEAPLPFLDLDKHDLFENEMPTDSTHRKFLLETTDLSKSCHIITENFARFSDKPIKLLNSDDAMVHGDVQILNQTIESVGWDRRSLGKQAYHKLLRYADPDNGRNNCRFYHDNPIRLVSVQSLSLPDALYGHRALFRGKDVLLNNPIDWPTASKILKTNFNLFGLVQGESTLRILLHELFHATTPNIHLLSRHEQEIIADFGACITMLRLGYKHIFEKIIAMRQEVLDFNLLKVATKTKQPDQRANIILSYALARPLHQLYMHIQENINPAEFAKWDLKTIHEFTHEMAKKLSCNQEELESLFYHCQANHGKITTELHGKWEKRGDLWAKFYENKEDCTQRQRLQEITNQAQSNMKRNQEGLIQAFDALQKQHEGELLSPDYAMDYFKARAGLYRQARNNHLFQPLLKFMRRL